MLTLNGKPFITLDPYLDIPKMLSLRDEWEFLLCKSWDKIRTGVWNAGGHAPDDIYGPYEIFREKGLLYYVYERANEDRKTNPKLDEQLKYFEDRDDKHGLSRLLKLKYGAFDPYNILNIRKTVSSHYAADAYIFTEEDWNTYSWVDYIGEFPNIKNFVESLPMDRLGIVTVFYNEHYIPLGHHRDFNYFPRERGNKPETFPHRQELIWFRFDIDRPFYLFDLDEKSGKIKDAVPVEGHAAFFNHHNWHGNFDSYSKSSITVKVEGRFTPEFREQIGVNNLEYYYKED
jgi:hypothetical protein